MVFPTCLLKSSATSSQLGKLSPSIHEVKIQTRYFDFIQSGEKKVEGKVNKRKYAAIEKGDLLRFQDAADVSRTLLCEVISKAVYPSFREMLQAEGVSLCLPNVKTLEEGIRVYHSFPNYERDSKIFQVVAFRILYLPHLS